MAFGDDPQAVITGNLTADPELRFTPSGTAVATFTVAHTPQVKRGDKWEDDTDHALFMRVTCWRWLAENVTSLAKGQRVTVRGTLRGNHWEDKESGQKRSSIEMVATDVAASLAFATVTVHKATRTSEPAPTDPWSGETATERQRPATASTAAGNGGGGFADEPPF